jgi:hypothetical protein
LQAAGQSLLCGEDETLRAGKVDQVAQQRILRRPIGGLRPAARPLRVPGFAKRVKIGALGHHERER